MLITPVWARINWHDCNGHESMINSTPSFPQLPPLITHILHTIINSLSHTSLPPSRPSYSPKPIALTTPQMPPSFSPSTLLVSHPILSAPGPYNPRNTKLAKNMASSTGEYKCINFLWVGISTNSLWVWEFQL